MNKRTHITTRTLPKRNLVRMTLVLFMAASLFFAVAIARAATDNASKATGTPSTAKEMQGYTAKKNMSVEELIKEVYAGTPLNNPTLVKALQEANPKMITGKLNQTLTRGQVVFLPDHAAVVAQTLATFAPPPPVAPDAANSGSQSSDPSSRRLWVRFP